MYPQAFNREAALIRVSADEVSQIVEALEKSIGDGEAGVVDSFKDLQANMANLATKDVVEIFGTPPDDTATEVPDLDPVGRFARAEERRDDLARHRTAG